MVMGLRGDYWESWGWEWGGKTPCGKERDEDGDVRTI